MPKFKYIESLTEEEDHLYDDFRNGGYDYEHHILKNVISPELFGNPLNDAPLRLIERLIECLINSVKQIKLAYAFTYPKNSKTIN